ncbi:BatA domain-containing protein [Leeuwenhoekiella palythoae]|uniref:Membrane protein (TIGR02226 family) n=1 Tax=Leeuwenhoekiella palythoae TaxID=573501 RepID=A0A1M5ZJ26_9FLAO|nr:BatA domain-containing protein [Leeuwenhoekiella palythoae]RXG27759.1 putative membrane protein (TIGR02226 family) [Leeuwenhoekiella palythoae]SHI24144.1 N-terminal double-transmembrane domain-containing protein [Leeuwenhoekiella palythoae]
MFFANPMYLWALLGLAVPVAIHLWSKDEGRTIKVGSIANLRESENAQTRTLQLNEWLLLLLRLLVIALLVVILAEPFVKTTTKNQDLVYLVEPELLKIDTFKTSIDSLAESKTVKLFLEDFPEYNAADSVKTVAANYWQLAQDFEMLKADSLVVFSQSLVRGFKGKRPEITENVNWVTIDSIQTVEGIVALTQLQDSVEVLEVKSTKEQLRFKKSVREAAAVQNLETDLEIEFLDTLQVYAFAEDSLQTNLKFLKTGFEALSTYLKRPITVTEITQNETQQEGILIWISLSDTPEFTGTLLKYQPDAFDSDLIAQNGTHFSLTLNLTRKNVVEQHLAEQLLPLLNLYPELEKAVQKYDRRVLADAFATPLRTAKDQELNHASSIPLTHWFWLALLIALIVERLLSRIRKQ